MRVEAALISVEVDHHVATVMFDRPPVNAVDHESLRAIRDTFTSFTDDRDVRAVIFTAAGERAFIAGADLKEIDDDRTSWPLSRIVDRGRFAREAMWAIYDCAVPVIAAVNGPAIGAGVAFAAVADLIVAWEEATFATTEINVGLLGASAHLSLLVGRHKARELFFTGDAITAEELHHLGAVARVVPRGELLPAARALADRLAAKSPLAFAAGEGVDESRRVRALEGRVPRRAGLHGQVAGARRFQRSARRVPRRAPAGVAASLRRTLVLTAAKGYNNSARKSKRTSAARRLPLLATVPSESGDAHRHVGPLSTIANLPAWLNVGRVMPRAAAVAWRGRNPRRNDPVPAMRPAPTTFAAMLFDELAVTIVLLRRSGADMLDFSAARRDAERAVTVLDDSGALDHPLSLHAAPGPPMAVRLTRRVRPGVRFEHLSFESTYVPPQGLPARPEWFEDGANQIAHAYVLRHRDGPRPWIVVLHPYAMGEPRDLLFAGSVTLHRELGVNVLHPVIPRHGPRARMQSALFFPSADPLTNLYGFSQAIRDIRQAIAWARTQGATAVGVHGMSLGGFMTALLAGLEPGLDVVIAGEPPVEFVRLIARHARRIRGEQAEIVGYSREDAVRTLGRLASPLGYEPLVPWSRRYIYAAVGDRFAPPSHAADLWRHWDNPEIVWHQGSHISGVMARPWRRLLRAALRDGGVIAPSRA